jgi:hypothetical protein
LNFGKSSSYWFSTESNDKLDEPLKKSKNV